MRNEPDRAIFTVGRHNGGWAVEYGGEFFGQSPDKEIAKAEAAKRMRVLQDGGKACQIRIIGEHGFHGVG
jgi:hypothetical protein